MMMTAGVMKRILSIAVLVIAQPAAAHTLARRSENPTLTPEEHKKVEEIANKAEKAYEDGNTDAHKSWLKQLKKLRDEKFPAVTAKLSKKFPGLLDDMNAHWPTEEERLGCTTFCGRVCAGGCCPNPANVEKWAVEARPPKYEPTCECPCQNWVNYYLGCGYCLLATWFGGYDSDHPEYQGLCCLFKEPCGNCCKQLKADCAILLSKKGCSASGCAIGTCFTCKVGCCLICGTGTCACSWVTNVIACLFGICWPGQVGSCIGCFTSVICRPIHRWVMENEDKIQARWEEAKGKLESAIDFVSELGAEEGDDDGADSGKSSRKGAAAPKPRRK
jgi:hypothetical protein